MSAPIPEFPIEAFQPLWEMYHNNFQYLRDLDAAHKGDSDYYAARIEDFALYVAHRAEAGVSPFGVSLIK